MTNEEALPVIRELASTASFNYSSALSAAEKALEKQIGKEVVHRKHEYIGNYEACPSCGCALSILARRYCTFCGQRFKWSENDEP